MARAPRHPRLAVIAAVAAAAAGIYGGSANIGAPLRWVHVLGLFAAGVSTGVAIMQARQAWVAIGAADQGERPTPRREGGAKPGREP